MLWRVGEHEELTERRWEEGRARDAIAEIVADAEAACARGFWPGHELDDTADGPALCSLYLGSGGMLWALAKLGSSIDTGAMIAIVLERYRASPDFDQEAHAASLWMGETGLLVIAARLGSPLADSRRLRDLVAGNRDHPTWELMWGSPGTILAARAMRLDEELRDSAERLLACWDEATDVWTQSLYGRVVEILGPAHGFAGNVHALRGYVSDEILRERVTRLLERTALRDGDLVNWPPVTPSTHRSDAIRVQWCHGAPGIVSTLGDLMPPELALAGGELTWEAGPLRKGGGLCHGTAGNGFTFLRLFALTGDERWLDRARRFAMHASEQVERERTRIGRGRYTLWTGDIGVALYLCACIEIDPAFPTIDNL
jgi:hypothetical protein